jgi:hypothetical protein
VRVGSQHFLGDDYAGAQVDPRLRHGVRCLGELLVAEVGAYPLSRDEAFVQEHGAGVEIGACEGGEGAKREYRHHAQHE